MELSVVIPAYNEGKILQGSLKKVDDFLQAQGLDYEVVVVNDGSSDDTLVQLTALHQKRLCLISYEENRGKGFAIHRGMLAAQGKYRLFMDMDLSTDLAEIPKFLQCMQDGLCDICVGNRNAVAIFAQQRPWHRALLGKSFALLSSISSGYGLDDFTCGFKIFTADACEKVFPKQTVYNWAFDTQLIAIAHRLGLRIRQEAVVWRHHEDSKVKIAPAMLSSMGSLVEIWQSKNRIK